MPKELFIINFTKGKKEINGAFNTCQDAEIYLKENYNIKAKFAPGINNYEILDGSKLTGRCFNAFFYD